MLKGLEAVEVKFSEIYQDNIEFRLDSDFFQKTFIENVRIAKSKPHSYLKPLISDLKSFGAYSLCNYINFQEEGIPFIRCLNIKNGVIDFNNVLYIDEPSNELLWKSEVKPRMVLVTMSGTVGNATVALEHWNYPMNTNQDIAKIETSKVNPFFLSTFLNTRFGLLQMQRLQAGAIQQHLYLSQIEKLIIPTFSDTFQKLIEETIKIGYENIEEAKNLYSATQNKLLSKLDLTNWKPSEEGKAVKKFSKSFAISGRLDAEYYQPKFDEVVEVISNLNHRTLGSIATFKKSIEPGSDAYQTEGISFIRVSDITKFGLSQPEIHLDRKEFDLADLKPKKDTILLSKDGSVGIAYKVEQDLDVITSSALLHLTITDKEVLPDYLTLVLNSKLTQMQAQRDAGGSIIQHWRPDEIKQVLIPVLPMDTQKELTKQIKQSFKRRQESTKLIDIAKQAVELAIEKDEKTAMKFIKDNTE